MTSPLNRKLAAAKHDAGQARADLAETLAALQEKLSPASLASQAWEGVREKGGELADDAVEAVKARPVAASGAIAAFLLFLARKPIISAASRLGPAARKSGRKKNQPKPAPPSRAVPKE